MAAYHGCLHYDMAGSRQLEALEGLLRRLIAQYDIAFAYDNQLGAVCPAALAGNAGIYLASSFDRARSDMHPQIDIIKMIKNLST